MNTIELSIRRPRRSAIQLHFTGPASWQEVSPRQAVGLVKLRMQVSDNPELLFPALTLLYGIKPKHQRWLFDEAYLTRQGVDEEERELVLKQGQLLIDSIRWVGQTEPSTHFLVNQFRAFDFQYGSMRVLFSRLFKRLQYWSPGDALANCTFEEFMFADKAYRDGDLMKLAAVLYRPQRKGQRSPLNQESFDLRAQQFQVVEPALLELIGIQYESTLRYLQRCFPFVFPTDTASQSGKSTRSGNWLDVAIGMAKLDATKINQIEQLNLYLALKVLNEQLHQAEQVEEQIKQMSKS